MTCWMSTHAVVGSKAKPLKQGPTPLSHPPPLKPPAGGSAAASERTSYDGDRGPAGGGHGRQRRFLRRATSCAFAQETLPCAAPRAPCAGARLSHCTVHPSAATGLAGPRRRTRSDEHRGRLPRSTVRGRAPGALSASTGRRFHCSRSAQAVGQVESGVAMGVHWPDGERGGCYASFETTASLAAALVSRNVRPLTVNTITVMCFMHRHDKTVSGYTAMIYRMYLYCIVYVSYTYTCPTDYCTRTRPSVRPSVRPSIRPVRPSHPSIGPSDRWSVGESVSRSKPSQGKPSQEDSWCLVQGLSQQGGHLAYGVPGHMRCNLGQGH